MDATCLAHCLTEKEKADFEENGFLVVDDALSAQLVNDLYSAAGHIVADHRREQGIEDGVRADRFNFIGRDDLFLDLLDWPATKPVDAVALQVRAGAAIIFDRCDPIRRQLLGDSVTGNHSFTSPKEEDVPLREWIRARAGEDAVAP